MFSLLGKDQELTYQCKTDFVASSYTSGSCFDINSGSKFFFNLVFRYRVIFRSKFFLSKPEFWLS